MSISGAEEAEVDGFCTRIVGVPQRGHRRLLGISCSHSGHRTRSTVLMLAPEGVNEVGRNLPTDGHAGGRKRFRSEDRQGVPTYLPTYLPTCCVLLPAAMLCYAMLCYARMSS